ncbi:MAG TPA: hypothetical protein VMW24_08380 [Sedimentisphaerales bacterium]|nr:hypothetical protein [Sedimentisphaerales bacterium]
MSLDVSLTRVQPTEVFSANITHNLNRMAETVGIYKHLWRPDEIGITKAGQLVEPLCEGLRLLRSDPERFKALEPANKWGTYDGFVSWLTTLLQACEKYPDADFRIHR